MATFTINDRDVEIVPGKNVLKSRFDADQVCPRPPCHVKEYVRVGPCRRDDSSRGRESALRLCEHALSMLFLLFREANHRKNQCKANDINMYSHYLESQRRA